MTVEIIHGDCRVALEFMPSNSVHSVVTDPPYALVSISKRFGKEGSKPAKPGVYARSGAGFMGKTWDNGSTAFDPEFWLEALRVLRPGGHVLAFGGTRTYHRLASAIEDAGFEIRDQIGWLYGSGFPKSYDAAQMIEKKLTTGKARRPDRDLGGLSRNRFSGDQEGGLISDTGGKIPLTKAEALEWEGWGTALKPGWEPIVVARKPLDGTNADNLLRWGVGSLNIDGCRVGGENGRWPANVIHDGSDEVLAAFPSAPGQIAKASSSDARETQNVYGAMKRGNGREGEPSADSDNEGTVGFKMKPGARRLDSGSAARFFYCAKASKKDRDDGLEAFEKKKAGMLSETSGRHITRRDEGYEVSPRANTHPTVKPTELMRYLCRLVTPPGGTVLDPFMGSGSTGRGAVLEGFNFIGCEMEAEYAAIARARIAAVEPKEAGVFA